ncbi:hypothetical protein [Nakamurella lactea]|uniref:hypothetical protein n=1 Tax=Nakamurella lactea TaxID=459515 RepID=UPI0004069133|nr:hypothetical protein [Nakamurella lactea]
MTAATNTSRVGDVVRPRGFAGLVGMAQRDVTPPVGIRNRNWGPATVDIAEGVHRPFLLVALALRAADGGDPVVVIGVDATWWRRVSDFTETRDLLLRELGLSEQNLLFSLSHTHAGAVLGAGHATLPGGELIPGYLEELRQAAVAAGREALGALQPGAVQWATGHCDLAANREAQVDGRAVVGFDPTVTADDAVLVGRVTAADGRVLGTVVNYACHPTTLAWENRLLSPDYVGAMRETVEQATGAPCLFLQGASGDLAPREQYVGDVAVADRHGRALGHSALAALGTLPPPGSGWQLDRIVESGAPLACWRTAPVQLPGELATDRVEITMPLRPLPTIQELEAEWADIDPLSRDERLSRARDLRDGYITGDTVIHPLWTVRIGDAVIVAHPGEAYAAFQTDLRDRFPDLAVVAVNLTNGPGFVYLPTDEAYQRNAYQAWQTALAEGALARLTAAAVERITAIMR